MPFPRTEAHKAGRRIAAARILLLTALAVGMAGVARANEITLTHGNSRVLIETGSTLEAHSFTVDGVDHMSQQASWYRVGAAGPELPVATLAQTALQAAAGSLNVTYTHAAFTVAKRYTLLGGAANSAKGSLGEQITITNTSGAPLDLHFFQYVDLDVDEVFDNNTLAIAGGGAATQTSPAGTQALVTVSPAPSAVQAGFHPTVLDALSDAGPSALNGATAVANADATYALRWSAVLQAGGRLQITLTKSVQGGIVAVAPVPLAPKGTLPAAPNPPEFRWEAIDGITTYDVEFWRGATHAAVGTSFTPDAPIDAGVQKFWRVRGRRGGAAGPWSAWVAFTVPAVQVGAATPAAPTGNLAAAPNPPEFSWTAATNASDYDVEFYRAAVHTMVGNVTAWTPPAALPAGQVVWWRVRGRNGGSLGRWSAWAKFTIAGAGGGAGGGAAVGVPVPVGPNGTVPNTPNPPAFTFTAAAGAVAYDVEFHNLMVVNNATTLTTWTPLQPLPTGQRLWWRVRGRNLAGVGAWSRWAAVTVTPLVIGVPVPTAPTGVAGANPPAFTWGAAANAAAYDVEIWKDQVYPSAAVGVTTWTPGQPLTPARLWWRVRGRNGADASTWSAWTAFTVNP
jgi:hypothetical protein